MTTGARVEFKGLRRAFGGTVALDDLDLTIEPGELVALLGPSGCGKTTALRVIAGFEQPDAGAVLVDGEDITRVPANRRDAGMVFQSYSLFPNLNARDNVSFGMRVRKVPAAKRRARAEELLALVGLPEHGDRYPHQLSGGQQQRVALARALALEPRVLLLDEPLSALDAKVRVTLREEIRKLQLSLHITTIFVTHDQEEALSIADRVAVMRAGRVEQCATPSELYDRPTTAFVAEFVGTMNHLPGVVSMVPAATAPAPADAAPAVAASTGGAEPSPGAAVSESSTAEAAVSGSGTAEDAASESGTTEAASAGTASPDVAASAVAPAAPEASDAAGIGERAVVTVIGQTLPVDGPVPTSPEVNVLIRPEAVLLTPDAEGSALILDSSFRGASARLRLELADGTEVFSDVPGHDAVRLAPGTRVSVRLVDRPVLVAPRPASENPTSETPASGGPSAAPPASADAAAEPAGDAPTESTAESPAESAAESAAESGRGSPSEPGTNASPDIAGAR